MGLSVMMYESTLVADQTPFDKWMETGNLNGSFNADALAGLNLFVGKGNCVACHGGPELTKASVRNAQNGKNVIEPMQMASKALHCMTTASTTSASYPRPTTWGAAVKT